MFSNIEPYLYMVASGALAVIFFFLAILADAEYESPLTGFHRPKKVLSSIFIALMVPFGAFGLLFVIPFSLVFKAVAVSHNYRRQKDLKFAFDLGQLTTKPCYQQLTFAAKNGSQQALDALEIFNEYRENLEKERSFSDDTERRRWISQEFYTLEHSHNWDDLPYGVLQKFDVAHFIAKNCNDLFT